MDFSFRDPETGQISTWVWIGAGLFGVIALVMFAGRGGGPATSTDTSGISSDATSGLSEINNALLQVLQGQSDLERAVAAKSRPDKPTTPAKKGYVWWYSAQQNKWQERKVPSKPKGSAGKGHEWAFSVDMWKWWKKPLGFGGLFVGPAIVGDLGQREHVLGIGLVRPAPFGNIGSSYIRQ